MECVWEEEVNYYNLEYLLTSMNSLSIVCRGVDEALLPAAVQTFSGCTIVNGDLTFNLLTYEEFM